jgi:hypothetical protein
LRKIFLLDVYKPSSRPLSSFLGKKIDRNIFVVVDAPFATKMPFGESNLSVNDLRNVVTLPGWEEKFEPATAPPGTVLALDHFDHQSDDPKTNQQKLRLVERLLEKKQPLLVFSALEPSEYSFANGDAGHENGNAEIDGRWARVMTQFLTEYAEDTGDPAGFTKQVEEERKRILPLARQVGRTENEINELINTLHAECIAKGPLQQLGLQILAQKSFITLTREHLLNRIINQARTYYTHLWNSCSTPEKVTLFHLAKDRLLSHRDPDIERLMRRELIVRDVDIHLLNDSFREFIKSTENEFMTAEETKAKAVSPWHTLKGPIFLVLVAVTVFLFVTQRDFYTSSLAILTAVTTLIPAFFKVLTIFHSDPFSRPPGQS